MNTNNLGRVLVSLTVVFGFMMTTYIFLTTKAMGVAPSETLTLLVGALASNFTSVVSYWIGSSSGSTAKDEQLSKTAEKLAEKVPTAAAAPAVSWWDILTAAERSAIEAAAGGDPRIAGFVTAAKGTAANSDDLDYLVSKSLLAVDRADALKKVGVI